MPIRAMIMAGGEGTRLRPLTMYRPKPLAPLLGKPCMWYALALLKKHGVEEVGVSLWYMPKAVKDAFGDTLSYYEEDKPVGTAGSVRLAKDDLAETFLVLSGDGLTDCDLTEALRFHKEKGAAATLILKAMPVPLSYGVVLTDENSRVTSFLEKPEWAEVFSDLVNTGIYILERSVLDLIPEGEAYDFGQDLFPRMVREGLPVYGYETRAYWCDVGDQAAYLQAQTDLMEGLVDLPLPAEKQGEAFIEEGAVLCDGAKVTGPVYISKGARLEKTCLWENAAAGCGAQLRGAVLCDHSHAHAFSMMEEDTALGTGAELFRGAVLKAGVKVWPHRVVKSDARVYESVVWGNLSKMNIVDGVCRLDTPREADSLAGALYEALKVKRAMVVKGEGAQALTYALIGALCARGVQVIRFDSGSLPALRRLQAYMKVELGLFVEGRAVTITVGDGEDIQKPLKRKIEMLAHRQDYPETAKADGEICAFSGAEHLYAALLSQEAPPNQTLRGVIGCENAFIRNVATELMAMLECCHVRVAGECKPSQEEIGWFISADGGQVSLVLAEGVVDDMKQAQLFFSAVLSSGDEALFLQKDAPRAVLSLLPEGVRVLPSAERKQAPEAFKRQNALFCDGLLKMLLLMRSYPDRAALKAAMEKLPKAARISKDVPCPQKENGRILRGLMNRVKQKPEGDGIWMQNDGGVTHLMPYDDRAAFKVTAEAYDMETALELCDLYAKDINALLDNEP